ncbi:MAG: N-acetyl sugar amidotransferase [Candidatus Omnitrophica bacterium]|nr:N-acetyl sugar amidotransferase [Candidatus Omnitrophota bacterium]
MSLATAAGREEALESKYGLPRQVVFCRRCVMSNQRPCSSIEFLHTNTHKHRHLHIDEAGVCDACRMAGQKEQIDWNQREQELRQLLDQHRRSDGEYDCLVPGSGGKDSCYAAHILKYRYGMHPLTVTWPPGLYTDIGLKNFHSWITVGAFDNVTFRPNGRVHALLTRLSIENLLNPFQTFVLGQKNLAPKVTMRYGIKLIFYGENEAEYGNPIADNTSSLRDRAYYAFNDLSRVHLGGVSVPELRERYGLTLNDLLPYLPADPLELERSGIEVRYLGYYLKWTPQEAYYYAVEHCGFEANPFRTEGTYSKYNSLDDKADGLHYYTAYIKFGLGRASSDASQEIRNKHLTREEGVALVRRFDGEFPERYFREVMESIGMAPEQFLELCDEFRSPHLWRKEGNTWQLRHQVS